MHTHHSRCRLYSLLTPFTCALYVPQIHTVVNLTPESRLPPLDLSVGPPFSGAYTKDGAGALVAEKRWLLRSEIPITDFAFSHERTRPGGEAHVARGWEDFTVYFLLKDGSVHNLFPVCSGHKHASCVRFLLF